MNKEAAPRTPPDPLYTKAFRPLLHFEDWVARWTAAETVDEAVGLLHVLPNHFSEDRTPVGVRFLLEYLDAQEKTSCGCTGTCTHTQVRDKARELLTSQLFRDSKERQPVRYTWYNAFCEDPTLFPIALRVLGQPYFILERERVVQQFVARCMEAYYGERQWREEFSELVAQHLETLLPLNRNPDNVRDNDRTEPMLSALRNLSFRATVAGRKPRDLEEAIITPGNEWYARKLLVLEAYAKAKDRKETPAAA